MDPIAEIKVLNRLSQQMALVTLRLRMFDTLQFPSREQSLHLEAFLGDIDALRLVLRSVGQHDSLNVSRLVDVADRVSYGLAEVELQVKAARAVDRK